MSRIGKTPVKIADSVKITIDGKKINVQGKLGSLDYTLNEGVNLTVESGEIIVTREEDTRDIRAMHGLTRALINNMVIGVSEGFEKELEVIGVGYSAVNEGPWLKLSLGYSHDILVEIPEGLTVTAEAVPRSKGSKTGIQSIIKIKGIRKEEVGNFAAEIRKCRPPENYKGKGIRYKDEHVTIKAGKSGAK